MTNTTQKTPELTLVQSVYDMNVQRFRMHCMSRHSRLRFWTRGEHDASHRLSKNTLDHVHEQPDGA